MHQVPYSVPSKNEIAICIYAVKKHAKPSSQSLNYNDLGLQDTFTASGTPRLRYQRRTASFRATATIAFWDNPVRPRIRL
jgi:hypothetical protein